MPGFEWFGEEERKEVQDVLNTGILMRYNFEIQRNGHWKAKTLEEGLRAYTGAKYVHVCNSGTASLLTALAAFGVGDGDEVLMPTFTFVASFEALQQDIHRKAQSIRNRKHATI